MVIPGKAPANPGHSLIIPLEHRDNVHDLTDEEFSEMAGIMQRIHRGMEKAGSPVFFGINYRAIGGQSVSQ